MSTTLNERAHGVVQALATALDAAGVPAELSGLLTVEDTDSLVQAADLCQRLAVMFKGTDFEVTKTATAAFYVLNDQANRKLDTCMPCSVGMHIAQLHTGAAKLAADDLKAHTLCRCSCQR